MPSWSGSALKKRGIPFVVAGNSNCRQSRVVEEIQTHSKPVIERCYREFLLHSHDHAEREYPDATDQIREVLIHENYMSQMDIKLCLAHDLSDLRERGEVAQIEEGCTVLSVI